MRPTKVDALLGSLLEWIFLLHYSLEVLYDIIDFPFTCDSGGLMTRCNNPEISTDQKSQLQIFFQKQPMFGE
jgi:hypothetical protein